jgi:hypothetical protein
MTLDEKRERLILEIRELFNSGDKDLRRKLMLVLKLTKSYQSLKAGGQRVRLARGLIRIEPPPPKNLYPGRPQSQIESAEREFYRRRRRMHELPKRLEGIDKEQERMARAAIARIIGNRTGK